MVNAFQALLVVLAGILVGIADLLIKKAATNATFSEALRNSLMIPVALLYITQILFFIYVFANNWKFGIVGIMQVVFFSLFVLFAGYFVFGEKLTLLQLTGGALAIFGIILINL